MDKFDVVKLSVNLGLPCSAKWQLVVARRGKSVWRVDCPGATYAARVFRPGEDAGAAHEQAVMAAAREAGLAVPAVHRVSKLGNCPVLLVDWCFGRVLSDELRARPWAASRLGEAFGMQQAQLHLSNAEPVDAAAWIEFFGPVDASMHERLVQRQSRRTLVHLDYYPANLVFDGGTVSGILDWTNARMGDPRADLARTWTILRLVYRSGRLSPMRRLAEDLFLRGWWREYVRIAGPQVEMSLFLAWAVNGLLRIKSKREGTLENGRKLRSLARLTQDLRERAGLPRISAQALMEQALR